VPDPIASTFASRFRRPVPDPEASDLERPGGALRFWSLLPVALAFALFGAVVWLAYQDTSLAPPVGEPPLIKAAADPYKLPPDETEETTFGAEEGTVGRLWSDADQADQPERLLPTPETPLSPSALEEPATAGAPPADEPVPDATLEGSASAPAPAAPAAEAAGELAADVAAPPPTQSADPAQSAAPSAAGDESLREAEAALDRLLAEVTATSDDTDAPAATAATPAETAVAPPAPAEDQASIQPPTPPREEPATEPEPTPAPTSTATAAAPAERAPAPAPAERAPAPLPEVRPAGATTAAAPPAAPRAAPTQTAAATVAQAAVRRPPIAPGGDFRIQLAAVRGEADARRAWQLFMADLGPVLADVEPIFERAETANGVFYRVQVGPFASQEAAEGLCEQLKQRDASCFVIRR
jgi:SPOR domain